MGPKTIDLFVLLLQLHGVDLSAGSTFRGGGTLMSH